MDLYIQLQPKLQAYGDIGSLDKVGVTQSVCPPPDQDKSAGQARQEVTSLRAERTQYESQLRKANDKVTTLQQVRMEKQLQELGSFCQLFLAWLKQAHAAGDAAARGPHTKEPQHGRPAAHQVLG